MDDTKSSVLTCGANHLPGGVLRPGGLRLTARLLDFCAFLPDTAVIDIGCGAGITVEYLQNERGLKAIGVDLCEEMLQQGRERSTGLRFVRAAGEALPFTAGSFGGAVLECSLSVMRDTGKVLDEISRILVPGGKLAITDIYIRTGGDTAADRRECISGAMTACGLRQELAKNGFRVMIWEDQSALLKEFVACLIMEYGSIEKVWPCVSAAEATGPVWRPDVKAAAKPGYFLLVAEKNLQRS